MTGPAFPERGGPPQASVPAPTENPVWNIWDVLLISILAFATMIVTQVVIFFGAHFLFYPRMPLAELAQQSAPLLVSQFLLDIAVVAYLFLLIEGKYHTHFWPAIRWDWPKAAWALLGLGAFTFVVLAMLGNFLPMPKETPFDRLFEKPRDAYLLAILATTLGPLMEELFFRGFLYPVVARRLGVWWGIFLAALPFALLHLQQYGFAWGIILLIFGVGLVCGIVRAATKSVGASFLVHAGYNGTQMLIAVMYTHGFTRAPKALLDFGRW